jgi:hypothetical protein
MTLIIHNELSPASCHPPKAVTFTGDPAAYVPAVAGILVLKTDVTPNQLYRTTGTAAGNVVEIGSVGGPEVNLQQIRSADAPSTAPVYDGNTGVSFYIRAEPGAYGGPPTYTFYVGVDTTGASATNGWLQLQNF